MFNFNEKICLPHNIFHSGSSYSAAYNSYNFVDRRKLFAALNSQVNCLIGLWYCDLKYAFKFYQMNGCDHEYIICNMK